MLPRVILLGPQRFRPTVGEVVRDLALEAPFALITAGWKEREGEDEELRQALGRPSYNLGLYAHASALYGEDRELHAAIRARQTRLRDLQELYRARLEPAMDAVYRLEGFVGKEEALVHPERESALEMVRALDRHHLGRVGEIREEHRTRHAPLDREPVARRREAMATRIHQAGAVFIAGGHVALLLNRLRLFDLAPILRHKLVVAWSAGAMAASERIVLFHDHPPQGRGHAEVLDQGLSLFPGVLPLPHASARLHLHDPRRVGVFARRFSDQRSVALDPGARVAWRAGGWKPHEGVRQLTAEGVAPWGMTNAPDGDAA
ncbi:MAG: Type 1 glutamine amidotransferase-like domain-containing protein [Myxococcota bacterium]